MPVELIGRNVVLTSVGLNPLQFQERWLIASKLATEKEIDESPVRDNICVPVVAKVETVPFQLLVTPDRIQVALRAGVGLNVLSERIARLVEVLGGIPWTAVGVNFNFKVILTDPAAFDTVTRRLFLPDSSFSRALGSRPVACGAMLFSDELDGILMCEVKPARFSGKPKLEFSHMEANVNFHFEIDSNGDRPAQIEAALSKLPAIDRRANELVNALEI